VIGVSQSEFATLVGCSAHTIQAIENGRLRVSHALEARIFVETGASTHEIIKGRRGKPIDQNGQPYSSDFYQSWKTRKKSYDRSSALRDFEALLADAARCGKLPEMLVIAQEWFFDQREYLREAETFQKQDCS
jgi:transcriptional regulator with XRE-family HTH domain